MINNNIYKACIENAIGAFFLTRPDGTILEVNQAACEMFGYTAEEFTNNRRQHIIDQDSYGMRGLNEEQGRTGVMKRELTGIRKGGERFPVAVSSGIFHNTGEEQLAFMLLQDITEHRKQEQGQLETTLDDREKLFMALVENSADIFIQVNQQREIAYVSPAVKRIMGFDIQDMMGKRLREFVVEEDLPQLLKEFEEILASPGKPFTKEYRVKTKQGGFLWVEGTVTNLLHLPWVNSVIINQRDITEKKEKEKELLKTNERFFYAAKATNDAIWDWDLESDAIVRMGDGLKNIFGYDTKEAAKDKNFWTKLVHPEDIDRMLERRHHILHETQELYWDDEYRFLKADGAYAHIFDKGYIIRNTEGIAIRMIGATQNITPQREAEALLLELNNRLKKRAEELSSSNVELERFAYVASHDLQEPLRMVTSFLQLFKKKYEKQMDEAADQYIHFAVDGAERMKKLIMDLLEYSRVGSNKQSKEAVDLNVLLAELSDMFIKMRQKTHAEIIIYPLPVVNANRTQLFQLFQNLVGNAIKYHGKEPPVIEISCTEEADHHLFKVQDNGIGIAPAFHDKIFIIFQRLHNKSEYSGTGIGLAICKKIVERHGGNIWVESEQGKGSCFYFTISKTGSHL